MNSNDMIKIESYKMHALYLIVGCRHLCDNRTCSMSLVIEERQVNVVTLLNNIM